MKQRLLYIIISVLLIGGAIFYFNRSSTKSTTTNFFGVSTSTSTSQTANVASAKLPTHSYTNTAYHFSLDIPEDAKPSEFADAGGDTVLIQDKTSQVQVFITPFDEDITLTKERIERDVPDLGMQNPTTVSVDGVGGVAFTTVDGGTTYRQVWFVHKGFLYQTLSPVSQDTTIGHVMQSWAWQ